MENQRRLGNLTNGLHKQRMVMEEVNFILRLSLEYLRFCSRLKLLGVT
jgi:hypothetical protein